MDELRYETLLNCLLDGRCVLVIGPELFKQDNQLMSDLLCEYLGLNGGGNPYIDFFDPKDELFYFKGRNLAMSKNAIYRKLRDFHYGLSPTALHEKIAELPFPLIVNTVPDLLLANAFEKKKLPHEFRFYHKNLNRDPNNVQIGQDDDEAFDATPAHPLLYNLMGHIRYEESLILTYSDLFDFLFNVFGRNNLPISLRNILEIQDSQDVKDYLFLGFRFNKWYLQVILRLLNTQAGNQRFLLGEGAGELERLAEDRNQEDKGIFYLQNYFTFELMDSSPEEILEKLYQDCAQKQRLRTSETAISTTEKKLANPAHQSLEMKLQELLMRNKVRQVFDLLLQFFREHDKPDLVNICLLRAANYERMLEQEAKGLAYRSELSVERNQVLDALSKLVQEVKLIEQTASVA